MRKMTQALRKMGYEVRWVEDYVATDERTDVRCSRTFGHVIFMWGIASRGICRARQSSRGALMIASEKGTTPPCPDPVVTNWLGDLVFASQRLVEPSK